MRKFETTPRPGPGGRSRRGAHRLREIHSAAAAIIGEHGLGMASQEQIARRVGISQSTLRHHYPTKEALVDAIFEGVFERHRQAFEALLLEPGGTPARRLVRLVEAHLDYIASADDAYTFEAFAHSVRSEATRRTRDAWYAWLVDHYAALLALLRPDLAPDAARAIGFQILSLSLGAWITVGRSRPKLLGRGASEARNALLQGVQALASVPLRD